MSQAAPAVFAKYCSDKTKVRKKVDFHLSEWVETVLCLDWQNTPESLVHSLIL